MAPPQGEWVAHGQLPRYLLAYLEVIGGGQDSRQRCALHRLSPGRRQRLESPPGATLLSSLLNRGARPGLSADRSE